MRIRGYFSKPKGIREQKHLGKQRDSGLKRPADLNEIKSELWGWGLHGWNCQNCCRLECDVVLSGKNVQKFQRYCLCHHGVVHHDDRCGKYLWNVGMLISSYMTLNSRRECLRERLSYIASKLTCEGNLTSGPHFRVISNSPPQKKKKKF